MIETQKKKEIHSQIEYIQEVIQEQIEKDKEDWYVYLTLRDELRQLEIMLEREQVI